MLGWLVRPRALSTFLYAACVASALLACGRPVPQAPAAAPPAAATSEARTDPQEAHAYPPSDRVWTAKDYEQLATALNALPADGKQALPGLSGDSALFSRMVSQQNLAGARDRSLSFDARMSSILDLEPSAGAITKVYIAALESGQPLGRELLALLGFMVHIAARTAELCDELTTMIDPADPQYVVRMNGLDQVVRGIEKVLSGTLVTAGTLVAQSAPFWRDVGEDWSSLFHRVGRTAQERSLEKLSAIERGATDSSVRAAIGSMQRAIASLPDPDFVVTPDEIRDASGTRLCPFPKDRKSGALAEYKRNGPNDLYLVPVARVAATLQALRERPARVAVDAATPFRVLVEVLFTLAQSSQASTVELRLSGGDVPKRLTLFLPRKSTLPPSESALSFAAFVVRDGIVLKAKGTNVAPGCERLGTGTTVPNRNRRRDLDTLASCTGFVKRLSPDARQVALTANPEVPFSEVLAIADVLRGPKLDLFPGLAFAVPR